MLVTTSKASVMPTAAKTNLSESGSPRYRTEVLPRIGAETAEGHMSLRRRVSNVRVDTRRARRQRQRHVLPFAVVPRLGHVHVTEYNARRAAVWMDA